MKNDREGDSGSDKEPEAEEDGEVAQGMGVVEESEVSDILESDDELEAVENAEVVQGKGDDGGGDLVEESDQFNAFEPDDELAFAIENTGAEREVGVGDVGLSVALIVPLDAGCQGACEIANDEFLLDHGIVDDKDNIS